MKDVIMQVHNALIVARVLQTYYMNQQQMGLSFNMSDLVYLSTKNLMLLKKWAWKLVPKFIRLYSVINKKSSKTTY